MGIRLTDNDYNFIKYDPDVTASGWAGIDKGDVLLVNGVYCFAFNDYVEASDDYITMVTKTKQAIADKATGTGEAIAAGELVYLIVATGLVTTTAGGNILIGNCIRDAAASDATVDIDFDGMIYNLD